MLSIADQSLYKVGNGQQPAWLRKGDVAQKTTKNGVIFREFMQTIQHFDIVLVNFASQFYLNLSPVPKHTATRLH